MNELMNNEITMTSLEVVELVNKLRKEEGNEKVKRHDNFIRDIDKEVKSLRNVGVDPFLNFEEYNYEREDGRKYRCYKMNKQGIMQMLNKESAYVRYKTQQYIEALENKLKEQDRKKDLLLAIYNGGQNAISASKELTELEVKEATKPLLDKIEKDEPLVTFAEQILKDGDNILVRELAKLASDHLNIKIGEKGLYKKLREWNYICNSSTEPTQNGMNLEYFIVETRIINTPYGNKQTFTTFVTPKGQVKIIEKLRKEINN